MFKSSWSVTYFLLISAQTLCDCFIVTTERSRRVISKDDLTPLARHRRDTSAIDQSSTSLPLRRSNAIRIYCIFCIKFIKLSPFSYSLKSFFSLEVPFIMIFSTFLIFRAPPPFLVVWQIGEGGIAPSVNILQRAFLDVYTPQTPYFLERNTG